MTQQFGSTYPSTIGKGNTMNTKKNTMIRNLVLTVILITTPSLAGAFPVYFPSGPSGAALVGSVLCSSPAGCATGPVSDTFNGIPWTGSAASSVALNTADLAVIATLSGADHSIQAQASARIIDTLSFHGAFAPDARAVFTMTATGTAAGGDPNFYGQASFASMYFGGYYSDTGGADVTIWSNVIDSGCFANAAGVVKCASSDGTSLSISLDFPLSSLSNGLNFHMSLDCTAYGNASGYGSSSCSYIDPFTITLPAGVTFTSASGQFLTAPTSVPEPTTMWLFGSGLLGLMGIARRKIKA